MFSRRGRYDGQHSVHGSPFPLQLLSLHQHLPWSPISRPESNCTALTEKDRRKAQQSKESANSHDHPASNLHSTTQHPSPISYCPPWTKKSDLRRAGRLFRRKSHATSSASITARKAARTSPPSRLTRPSVALHQHHHQRKPSSSARLTGAFRKSAH